MPRLRLVTREVALQVDHAVRLWLVATAKVLYGNDDTGGSSRDDNRYSASAAITSSSPASCG